MPILDRARQHSTGHWICAEHGWRHLGLASEQYSAMRGRDPWDGSQAMWLSCQFSSLQACLGLKSGRDCWEPQSHSSFLERSCSAQMHRCQATAQTQTIRSSLPRDWPPTQHLLRPSGHRDWGTARPNAEATATTWIKTCTIEPWAAAWTSKGPVLVSSARAVLCSVAGLRFNAGWAQAWSSGSMAAMMCLMANTSTGSRSWDTPSCSTWKNPSPTPNHHNTLSLHFESHLHRSTD